jgi:hypothetical protein
MALQKAYTSMGTRQKVDVVGISCVFAWIGSVCAVSTRQSTNFVRLRNPLIMTQSHEPIDAMGIIRLRIGYNETIPDG